MSTTKAFDHLGMRWTGAGREADGRKVLIAENLDSRRRWAIDPVTGIGEPLREEPGSSSTEARPAALRVAASQRADERTERRAGPAGPFRCEHCGAQRVYKIRFSQTEFMTKCLACKRFVVDGQVERPGRSRPAARRGASLWLPLE